MHHRYALTLYDLFITMTTKLEKNYGESTDRKEVYRLQLDETGFVKRRDEETKHRKKADKAWYYLGFVGQIGYAIALPIAGGGVLGEYIDRRFSTYPKATLLFLLLGIILSLVGFIDTIRDLIKNTK